MLQEREFERVGGMTPVKVDVRLILATNRNLERMATAGELRSDLYYCINVVSIELPPLRERREDIPAKAQLLARFNRENAQSIRLDAEAMRVLMRCYWPGKVRELENCVECKATMTRDGVIDRFKFLCQEDHYLTKVLHYIEREDAVRPAPLGEMPIAEVPSSQPPYGHHDPDMASAPAVWWAARPLRLPLIWIRRRTTERSRHRKRGSRRVNAND